ncbi:MAG: ATP-binding protein [Prevotellaceae bacterium]|nr:ATP-binding protein [Candidatus Colivivens caballi]
MEQRFDPIKDKTAEIIEAIMQSPDIPDDPGLQFKIRLSVEEATENIVQYAYAEGEGYVVVKTELTPANRLIITLRDEGVPFNPLDKDDPDITLSAEDRNIGGLGIFLCKQLMDKVTYTFENGCNILTMEKQITTPKNN